MQIWQLCWKFFARISKFFNKKTKMTKKSFVHEKYFCSDSSPGQIECSEDNRTEVLHSKCSKSASMSKNDQKEHIIVAKIVCPQNVRLDTQYSSLTTLPKLFRHKSELFRLKIRIWWKTLYFFKNYFPTNCSPWTTSLDFW